MRFSLKQLFCGVAEVGCLLAVLCWHPILGISLLLVCGFPVAAAMLKARPGIILFAAVPAAICLVYSWVASFDVSLSAGWRPAAVEYQATRHRGKVFFFRFHCVGERGNWRPWIDGYEDPKSIHWSEWPGFHDEHYWFRVPGVELARTEFVAPMIAQLKVDRVEVLTLSFWFVLAGYALFVALLAWRAGARGKRRPAAASDSRLATTPER
jgi:hypothetical protein